MFKFLSKSEVARPLHEVSVVKDPKNDSPAMLAMAQALGNQEIIIKTKRPDLLPQDFILEEDEGRFYLHGKESGDGREYLFAEIIPEIVNHKIKDFKFREDRISDFILEFNGRELMIGISPILIVEGA